MRYTILFSICFAIVACKSRSNDDEVDLGYNYYPDQVGATWVYKVDSLAYDDNSGSTIIDTFTYQYKEQITGSFIDVNGKSARLVSRYYRSNDTLPWIPANNATILKTESDAQRVQENMRFVKLLFPLELNKTWNGNAYNMLDPEDYTVTQWNEPNTVGGKTYDQTLRVLQLDELNAIEEIKQEEIYARNTGLVYLLSDSINTQVSGSRGFRYRLTLKSYTP